MSEALDMESRRVDSLARSFWVAWTRGGDGTDDRLRRMLACYGDVRAAEEARRWSGSLGLRTPEEVWVKVNESRALERAEALQDAIDAIRAACGPCQGSGSVPVERAAHASDCDGNCRNCPVQEFDQEQCEYCGRPIDAIKALPGAPA